VPTPTLAWYLGCLVAPSHRRIDQRGGRVHCDYIAGAISPYAPGVIGSLILIVFSISGFLIAYLVTKSDLAREIDLQDQR
jgi:hypothetical protein